MLKIVKRLSPVQTILAVLFLLVQAVCALSLPTLMSNMVNGGIITGNQEMILRTGAFMLLLTVLSLAGALLNTYISAKISYQMGTGLRREMFSHVLEFSKVDYDKLGTSSLITRCTNDVTQVQNLVEMGLKFLILCPAYLIGAIFFTYRLNPSYAYIFMLTLPVLMIAAVVIYKAASPLYEKIQILLDRLNFLFREGLSGVKVIRAFNKEDFETKKYQEVNKEYRRKAITAGTIMNMLIPFITLIVNLTTLLILWLGAGQMNAGNGNIGAIMGAVSYSAQILTGFGILTMVILAIPKGQVSARRIYEVLELEPELEEHDSEEEMWDALKTACADEFVRKMGEGLDSMIEKNGGNLSGGQKQRLCIARAIMKKANVYIFDDSFSALDFKTDARIREALSEKMTHAITIIVAQRTSTVVDADCILVLNNGKVSGIGTHEQLRRENELYREILESQTYREEAV